MRQARAGATFDRTFQRWPFETDASGLPRKVGVEMELGHLDVEAAARAVIGRLGGHIEADGHEQVQVVGTRIGDLRVETDSRFIKQEKIRDAMTRLGLDGDSHFGDGVEALVEFSLADFVPCEIVTEPLDFEQLPWLDALRADLHALGARGTGARPWYAFSVQFNPSLPSTEAPLLHAFLRAYCTLEDELREGHGVNWTRKISPFVDPFPEAYRDRVLNGPAPRSTRGLILDYLEHNPTRDRGLDMLPAFSYLAPDLVESYVQDGLIKSRPTFHYRLADSRFDDPDWTLAAEWESWIRVEKLAASYLDAS